MEGGSKIAAADAAAIILSVKLVICNQYRHEPVPGGNRAILYFIVAIRSQILSELKKPRSYALYHSQQSYHPYHM